jgi:hypothetical protein
VTFNISYGLSRRLGTSRPYHRRPTAAAGRDGRNPPESLDILPD